MKVSDKGLIELVCHEGIVPYPYLDSVGVWTYGIGHTAAAGEPNPATMPRGVATSLRACVELFRDEERDPEQYRPVFARMFGEETLAQAWANARGEARFHGLEAADFSLSQFPLHQKLLAAYEKLQKAKRIHTWN